MEAPKHKNCRYQLYIDEEFIYESDHIPYLKKKADEEFELFPWLFFAKIMTGKRVYSSRFYNTKWSR